MGSPFGNMVLITVRQTSLLCSLAAALGFDTITPSEEFVESSPALAVMRREPNPHGECPILSCAPPPRRCPTGSSIKPFIDDKGCAGCQTCVDANGKAVAIPICWQLDEKCEEAMCGKGSVPFVIIPEGKDGAKPCCPTYQCRAQQLS